MTYRFAFAGFWSVAAFAEVDLPDPLNDWGVIKGLLLRHFRWWTHKHDMFNIDGCLNIGFAYQNFYLCEDYNSPQSVYWALKSFLALGLPESHPFWTAEEKPLPRDSALSRFVKPPMHILCNTGNHHYLLSSGQFCPWPLKATEAKYGKFAYSSHFGFSVPTGPLVQQMAPDSTVAISRDGGDIWRVPWKVKTNEQQTIAQLKRGNSVLEDIPTFESLWKPWRDTDVDVKTLLIPPCSRWPDWHIRFSSVRNLGTSPVTLSIVQGGFANQGRGSKKGEVLPAFTQNVDIIAKDGLLFAEGTFESASGALICSEAGASGIRSIALQSAIGDEQLLENITSSGQVLKPDANTNLMWQRTLIPIIKAETRTIKQGGKVYFASAVFAAARTSDKKEQYEALDLQRLWDDTPAIRAENLVSQAWKSDGVYIDVRNV